MTPAFLFQISIHDCEFSVRTSNCLQRSGQYPTLGDLASAIDDNLLRIPGMGRKSLKEIRQVIRNILEGPLHGDQKIVSWALNHQIIIEALIAGEAVIVPKEFGPKAE